jgi:hypothetical protein
MVIMLGLFSLWLSHNFFFPFLRSLFYVDLYDVYKTLWCHTEILTKHIFISLSPFAHYVPTNQQINS